MSFSGNINPASTISASLGVSISIMFLPISPSPPSGMILSSAFIRIPCFLSRRAMPHGLPASLTENPHRCGAPWGRALHFPLRRTSCSCYHADSIQTDNLSGLQTADGLFQGEFDAVAFVQVLDSATHDGRVMNEDFLSVLAANVAVTARTVKPSNSTSSTW